MLDFEILGHLVNRDCLQPDGRDSGLTARDAVEGGIVNGDGDPIHGQLHNGGEGEEEVPELAVGDGEGLRRGKTSHSLGEGEGDEWVGNGKHTVAAGHYRSITRAGVSERSSGEEGGIEMAEGLSQGVTETIGGIETRGVGVNGVEGEVGEGK